ncbi:MAG TPA: hypothetical protein VJL58_11750 [Pyrinomonadaceae bacterium]|nr:hypothetical protein [Pyrinomonadaceae bacterium]
MDSFTPPTKLISFAFRAFGSTLRVDSNDAELLEQARSETSYALINKLDFIEPDSATPDRTYGLFIDGTTYRLYKDGEESTFGESRENFINFFNAIIRVAVGEHSESLVFLHAGVVGWKGKAIVLPANSFSGKTTLVAELVKQGAEYYSDEYAVIDADGLVHPFERDLSIRVDDGDTRVPISSLGGKAGTTPLPLGILLLTSFEPGASFTPERLSLGTAIVETIPFAIPLLLQPERTIEQLKNALTNAITIKTPRGEASEAAAKVLEYADGNG